MKKITLGDLKVKSFVTTINKDKQDAVKGGALTPVTHDPTANFCNQSFQYDK